MNKSHRPRNVKETTQHKNAQVFDHSILSWLLPYSDFLLICTESLICIFLTLFPVHETFTIDHYFHCICLDFYSPKLPRSSYCQATNQVIYGQITEEKYNCVYKKYCNSNNFIQLMIHHHFQNPISDSPNKVLFHDGAHGWLSQMSL